MSKFKSICESFMVDLFNSLEYSCNSLSRSTNLSWEVLRRAVESFTLLPEHLPELQWRKLIYLSQGADVPLRVPTTEASLLNKLWEKTHLLP